MSEAVHTRAGAGENNLMLGSVVCTTMLAGGNSDGELAMIDVRCPTGTGPGPHTDPWRESFFVLEGAFEFQLERGGRLHPVKAGPGDTISIPAGVGHAFRAIGPGLSRVLILSGPAGLETFFRDAGEPAPSATPPDSPRPFDRQRFSEANEKHGIRRFEPAEATT